MWSRKSSRRVLLRQWSAIAKRCLDEAWGRAPSCHSRVGHGSAGRYLELHLGAEQQHKSKFVVTDALFIAMALNRTLVEPSVRHARLGAANASSLSLALHHYWDLEPLCSRHRLISRVDFERDGGKDLRASAAVVRPRPGRGFPGGWRLHSAAAVRAALGHLDDRPLVQLAHMYA